MELCTFLFYQELLGPKVYESLIPTEVLRFMMKGQHFIQGSVCLLYKPLEVIFTGDHLIMTPTGLSIIEQYNRCSGKCWLECGPCPGLQS